MLLFNVQFFMFIMTMLIMVFMSLTNSHCSGQTPTATIIIEVWNFLQLLLNVSAFLKVLISCYFILLNIFVNLQLIFNDLIDYCLMRFFFIVTWHYLPNILILQLNFIDWFKILKSTFLNHFILAWIVIHLAAWIIDSRGIHNGRCRIAKNIYRIWFI